MTGKIGCELLSVLYSADAALRRAIPAFNPDLREVQTKLEEVAFKLRIPQRKPWQVIVSSIKSLGVEIMLLHGCACLMKDDQSLLDADLHAMA